MGLLDDLESKRIAEKADDHIAQQKHELALAAAPALAARLCDRIQTQVDEFKLRFTGDRIEGVIRTPDGFLKVRTQRFPLRTTEFRFTQAELEFRKRHQETYNAHMKVEEGSVLVKVDFDGNQWFEYRGERLSSVEELADMLLAELFTDASK
jgi:hypothetical protein